MKNLSKCVLTTITALSVIASGTISAEQIIKNGHFQDGLNSWKSSDNRAKLTDDYSCIKIGEPGKKPWDILFAQSGLGLEKGERYELSFKAYSDVKTKMKTLLQHDSAPYTNYFADDTRLKTSPTQYKFKFKQKKDSDDRVELQFQLGGRKSATICVGDISLTGKKYFNNVKVMPLRVNQNGYLPNANKVAVLQTNSKKPLQWQLINKKGDILSSGQTKPYGLNSASGELVQQIDFSNMTNEINHVQLKVGEILSEPFDISNDIYQQMTKDSFLYFYHNRSGIAIKEQYVQDSSLARPAGHPSDIASCYDKEDKWGNKWPGCDFELNLTGGWYDAGDHGKYVVNSGISVWTLLNRYERSKSINGASSPVYGDVGLLPESGNKIDNILNETRWNIEFMLSMQVPKGKQVFAPLGDQSENGEKLQLTKIDAGGLTFHKVADEKWSPLPTPPHKAKLKRYIGQPSTSASLSLAAIGAQCSRIWREIDKEFSSRCLTAAIDAWNASEKHPDVYAYNNFNGSGPYSDVKLSDEFYWAASELFITTGDAKYLDFIKSSKHYLEVPKGDINSTGDLYWQYMAPAGTISLALVDNDLPASDVQQARSDLIKTAYSYQEQAKNEGYNITYSVKEYPWGSNSNIVIRSMFLILGYDFSNDISLLKSAASNMDYILGTNPLNISYITGYGEKAIVNPHHRFWASQISKKAPQSAPGSLSGGPNSISFSDPVAASFEGNCISQTCFIDDIGAWTFNEITINWNSPLVWVTSALNDSVLKK